MNANTVISRLLLIVISATYGLEASAEWHYREHEIFGTSVSINLWAEDHEAAEHAHKLAAQEMWRIHNKFSPYIVESELSQLNQNGYLKPIKISDELAKLIDKSLFYSQISQGAFDISFASLGQFYNYREALQPNAQQLKEQRELIDYRLIQRHHDKTTDTARFLSEGVKIDLGGIAKGYAVEQVATLLKSLNIQHASLSAGGDSRMLGDKLGQPWIVGIRHPRAEGSVLKIPLDNAAISTSGDYERFFIDPISGERIHHILNPRTGKSASEVLSVSVIGPSATDTDPLSTALFVMGVQPGLALIEKLESFDAIFIDTNGKVHYSSGLGTPE